MRKATAWHQVNKQGREAAERNFLEGTTGNLVENLFTTNKLNLGRTNQNEQLVSKEGYHKSKISYIKRKTG